MGVPIVGPANSGAGSNAGLGTSSFGSSSSGSNPRGGGGGGGGGGRSQGSGGGAGGQRRSGGRAKAQGGGGKKDTQISIPAANNPGLEMIGSMELDDSTFDSIFNDEEILFSPQDIP